MNQQELERLSNREVKELWEQTRNERRKQMGIREAEARTVTDILDHNGDYYKDAFGNIASCSTTITFWERSTF